MPKTVQCDNCGAAITRPPSLLKGRHAYCDRECRSEGMRKMRTKTRRMRVDPSHPLAGKTGRFAEARAVLYDRIGPGPHPCHWCGQAVNWAVGLIGQRPDTLIADHVNGDPLDDRPENIVPACGTCNGSRTQAIRTDEDFVIRGSRRLRATPRTCETCGAEFLSVLSEVAIGKGRFCSRSCARLAPRRANA